MPDHFEINTLDDIFALSDHLRKNLGEGYLVEVSRNTRTQKQNKCLHGWLGLLAQRLNDAGYGVRKTLALLNKDFEMPWGTNSVKDLLYRPVMEAMTGKESTKDLDTIEPSDICQKVGARVSELTGITAPPWPDRFNGGGTNDEY